MGNKALSVVRFPWNSFGLFIYEVRGAKLGVHGMQKYPWEKR